MVPIAQTQAIGRVIVTLLSLESYAHGFIIHYRIIPDDQPVFQQRRVPPFGPLEFDVIDDRGAHYSGNQLRGGFDPHAWYYGYVYRLAIDPEAHEPRVRRVGAWTADDSARINWRATAGPA
jgi:hypothetical protein